MGRECEPFDDEIRAAFPFLHGEAVWPDLVPGTYMRRPRPKVEARSGDLSWLVPTSPAPARNAPTPTTDQTKRLVD